MSCTLTCPNYNHTAFYYYEFLIIILYHQPWITWIIEIHARNCHQLQLHYPNLIPRNVSQSHIPLYCLFKIYNITNLWWYCHSLPVLSSHIPIITHSIITVTEFTTVQQVTTYHYTSSSLPSLTMYSCHIQLIPPQPIFQFFTHPINQCKWWCLMIIKWVFRHFPIKIWMIVFPFRTSKYYW